MSKYTPSVQVAQQRLFPTRAQDAGMREALLRQRELYNAALQERRDAWRKQHVSLSAYDQMKELREVREVRPEYAKIHTHVLQDVLTRLGRAFDAFFRRLKNGEKPGYPRFKGPGQYNTFTFKDVTHNNGAKVVAGGKRLRIHGIGNVRVRLHRPLKGRVKHVSVTLGGDGLWYALIVCDVAPKSLPTRGRVVGLDLGLRSFQASSDGELVGNPARSAPRSKTSRGPSVEWRSGSAEATGAGRPSRS